MERRQWSAYLEDPLKATKDDPEDSVASIEALRQRFPYCRVLYLLQCRAMKEAESLEWKERAREWAILVPDRKKLFHLLNDAPPACDDRSEEDEESRVPEIPEKQGSEEQKSERSDPESAPSSENASIDPSPLEQQILTEAVRDRILYDAEDALLEEEVSKPVSEEDREEANERAKNEDLEDEPRASSKEKTPHSGKGQKRSFMDWLNQEERSSSQEEDTGTEHSEKELIEAFISQGEQKNVSPRSEKQAFFSSERMARNSSDESGVPVSETLAEIYVKQGNLQKAIQAFEQLRLNIPEKSDYFARRVQALKERTKR